MKFKSAPEKRLVSSQVNLDILNEFRQVQESAKERELKITLGDAMEEGMKHVCIEYYKLVSK
jgi:hypothetical protein